MYIAFDKVFPSPKIQMHIYLSNYAVGIEVDLYFIRHPEYVFDCNTYSKGASLIKFMSHFVGQENINKGLREYILLVKYHLRVRQERYLLNTDKQISPQTWIIPNDIDCVHESSGIKSHMLLENESEEMIGDVDKELKYAL
ncbi:hypothetical protein RF11_02088 [Thelohanellus kitauei]|uniref:Peptidase M1 membrane alanine aminopeptidase domain-containing protein n=1 Tax=Thelohanellus kitauei TaxID=669202 RepID=A0A0C2JB71_THEKT|nr:hypothetical protein RF11_02088 [Thelohanellus kitauei]